MVYQEQVMQIVHELGRHPAALGLRAHQGDQQEESEDHRRRAPQVHRGRAEAGPEKDSRPNELFELILKFAGYGFNKSHSTGYAIVAYQTAYLKTYFPAALHGRVPDLREPGPEGQRLDPVPRRLPPCSGETIGNSVEVRAPSLNSSGSVFEVVFDEGEKALASAGHIRFGMSAIKGVGTRAIEAIIAERAEHGPFTSLYDFCERCVSKCGGLVNKGVVDALIKSGCFDAMHGRPARASLTATIDRALAAGQKAAADKAAGQGALFGGFGAAPEESSPAEQANTTPLVQAQAWSEAETLQQEKETLGFYVSSHPLESWSAWASLFATHDIQAARELAQDTRVTLPAIVQSVRTIVLKQGKSIGRKMAIVTIEDLGGTMDAVLFAESYGSYGHLLESEEPIFVLGRLDLKRGDPQVIVDAMAPISGVPRRGGSLRLVVSEPRLNGGASRALEELALTLSDSGGSVGAGVSGGADNGQLMPEEKAPAVPIQLWVETAEMRYEIEPKRYASVRLVPRVAQRLRETLGVGNAKLIGGASIEEPQRPKWQQRGGGGGGDE
jgi:DNA polymerase III subunit alpha